MTKPPSSKKPPPAKSVSAGVRAKASLRKSRTTEVRRTARVPAQERSRLRHTAILDATERLLKSSNIEDISLYDVAAQAKLPPPSVHYLFNTVAAIHIELNAKYNQTITAKVMLRMQALAQERNPSWQAWTRAMMETAVAELNTNRAAAEIMLGPILHRRIRQANLEMNRAIGKDALAIISTVFVVPEIPHLDRYYTLATELGEALWSGAYAEHGRVDEETLEESVRAVIAYLRCFLPEVLHPRPLPGFGS